MIINFSRHAKRRAKLYNITEATIVSLLENVNPIAGKQTLIRKIKGFEYPLKIVFDFHSGMVTVITNYPLKKGSSK